MKPADIVYTPLDLPSPPVFDKARLYDWISSTHNNPIQTEIKHAYKNAVAETLFGDTYPWDLVFAYFNVYNHRLGWMSEFKEVFPELSYYLHNVFNISEEDMGQISILPIRLKSNGIGFWHNDVDRYGMRVYLDFEDNSHNSLLVKKTKLPLEQWQSLGVSQDYDWNPDHLQKEVHTCKMLKPDQCFYLNNMRAVHTTYVTKPSRRIAAFISGRPDTNQKIWKITEDIIVNSAKKYKDYAIMW
jgi:hypothetical protein